jgi:hypothetical protein
MSGKEFTFTNCKSKVIFGKVERIAKIWIMKEILALSNPPKNN